MRRRPLALLVLLAGVVALPAQHTGAHEEVPGIRNELVGTEPGLPGGVSVQVVISAADQLVASNATDEVLEVSGADGEPFLEIGPDGVLANFRSPTWHRTLNPDEGGALPPEADADALPQFVRVSTQPSWGWFDHRLHAVSVRSAPAAEPGETVVLEEWSVPVRLGGTEHVVSGRRVFSRPTGAFESTIREAPDGLQATVLGGPVPAIALTRTGTDRIELLDDAGELFALVAEEVLVDETSAIWRLTEAARRTGEAPTVPEVDDGPPTLVPYEAGGQLIWLEPRAVYPSEQPPSDVSDTEPTVVLEWEVPVRIDGRADAILGTTSWVPAGVLSATPPSGTGGGAPAWWPLLAGATAVGVVALLIRRRKSRQLV